MHEQVIEERGGGYFYGRKVSSVHETYVSLSTREEQRVSSRGATFGPRVTVSVNSYVCAAF